MPAGSGLQNTTGIITYKNGTYNYPNVNTQTITLTCTEVHTMDGFDYFYGSPTLAGAGALFYVNDYVSEILVNKAGAFFTIVFFILSPANFNILGYTINDIGGVALMFIISIYALCYIAIAAMLYKMLSPFAGAA